MGYDVIVQIFRELIRTTLVLMAPVLLASLVVGLFISIFQAATQIHEMTLVFVPKILAISACVLILFPWMLNIIVTYTINLITNIPVYVR
ncbi:MAG TPA: flagellar biosynthesis protein FliQ [Syntrophorhabdaceae bacterium]|nr:flagellar biosynthesis protein FliQ [Syntrophorhabdaceae bacterium]HOT41933.1 flagellar biosynthesis protein FliQ [Syntrophorhabdaceae bacterium]HPC67051.1 flagellar biosynthesis protein FliQ [Syntrophorhabdaceae bacterium]HPP05730.1 flagellar biosynthesis protein FliQ [Syntrophorhabdaceae bacterium]HQE79866.1 flagellar biosynthesis protein FliQ [Syntrophorhabdaceae bacterium]